MAIYAMADNDISFPVKFDASMYDIFARNRDFVFKGIRNEFECTTHNLVVTCTSGEGIIGGRHVTVYSTNADPLPTVRLNSNSTGYLVIRYDLNQTTGNEAYFADVESITQGDINNSETIRDLPLYQYTTSSSGVTLTDIRFIRDGKEDYYLRGRLPDGTDINNAKSYEYSGIWALPTGSTYYNLPEGFTDNSNAMTGYGYLEVLPLSYSSGAGLQRVSVATKCAQRRTTTTGQNDWLWLSNQVIESELNDLSDDVSDLTTRVTEIETKINKTRTNINPNAVTIPGTGSSTNLYTINFAEKGQYLLIVTCRFAANNVGQRELALATTPTAFQSNRMCYDCKAAVSDIQKTPLSITFIHNCSDIEAPVYVNVRQNSGSDLEAEYGIQYFKLN